jgi:hypothetical protein
MFVLYFAIANFIREVHTSEVCICEHPAKAHDHDSLNSTQQYKLLPCVESNSTSCVV